MYAVGWVGDAVTAGLGYADSLIGNALTWVGTVSGLLEGAANSTVANAVAYIGAVGTAFTGWSGAMSTGLTTLADRIIQDNTEGGVNNTGTLAYQQGTAGAPPATQPLPPPRQPDRRRLYDDCPLECRDELLELFRLIDKANAGPYDAGLGPCGTFHANLWYDREIRNKLDSMKHEVVSKPLEYGVQAS